MSTPRRSRRLRAKDEAKLSQSASLRSKRKLSGRGKTKGRRLGSSESSSGEEGVTLKRSESEEEEETVDPATLLSPVLKQRKPNNFLRVHSSYNYDRGGLDTYERDFIDDSFEVSTPLRRHKGKRKRARKVDSDGDEPSSDGSDEIRAQRPRLTSDSKKKVVLSASSSDSEGDAPVISHRPGDEHVCGAVQKTEAKGSDDEANFTPTFIRRRKKTSLNIDSDEGSSEEREAKKGGGAKIRKRRRLIQQPESDDEIHLEDTNQSSCRESSGRAMKLRAEKERERQKKLKRLRASRGAKDVNDLSSSDSQVSESDKELDSTKSQDQDQEIIGELVERQFFDAFIPAKPRLPTAEEILFPVEEEGSSEEDESDWIVSSSEEEGEEIAGDMKMVLEQLKRAPQKPILYHLEAGCKETEDFILEEDDSDELLEGAGVHGQLTLHQLLMEGVERREGGMEEEKTDRKEDDGESEREEEREEKQEEGEGEEQSAVATCSKLKRLLPEMEDQLESVDLRGYTPLMVAADLGDSEALKVLLEAGASVNCRDANLTTPLHLAALSGWVECVDVLISHGHPVDCRDAQGWPPLLYAHFEKHEACVLALMKAQPKQLSVLRDLLRRTQNDDPEIKRKTVKVVRSLLMSLAHHDAYYSIFNDFVHQNLSVLDEDGFSFMKHCMALLSFKNKQAWLKGKLQRLRSYASVGESSYDSKIDLSDLRRDNLLDTLPERLRNVTVKQCWICPPRVTFHGEAGVCTGPRREFWSCLCKELASEGCKLFTQCDEGQLSLQPCSIFSKYFSSVLPPPVLGKHRQLLFILGSLLACAVFHGDTLNLSLSKPLLKQLAGLSLSHPEDLGYVDQSFHHTMTTMQPEDGFDISDLDLTFTQTLSCPWTCQTVDVAIKEGGRTCRVTEENKDEFIKAVSKFKLEDVVKQELEAFLSGFWRVIPQKCLNIFTPDELSLLISGVPFIDVEDWSKNTAYHGFECSDDIVVWFWKLVNSLKEEEKALLLKFATGSPRVPAGGFSCLQGLGGPSKFTLVAMPGRDKIPQASTCFNMLKLSDYSCEKELRNKILIAIRYGCEGFAFS